MLVKELIKLLKTLPQNAIIDIASDEEGNSFGDISPDYASGFLKDNITNNKGKKVFSLYPQNSQTPEERYFSKLDYLTDITQNLITSRDQPETIKDKKQETDKRCPHGMPYNGKICCLCHPEMFNE